jgi:hypothetical protein
MACSSTATADFETIFWSLLLTTATSVFKRQQCVAASKNAAHVNVILQKVPPLKPESKTEL